MPRGETTRSIADELMSLVDTGRLRGFRQEDFPEDSQREIRERQPIEISRSMIVRRFKYGDSFEIITEEQFETMKKDKRYFQDNEFYRISVNERLTIGSRIEDLPRGWNTVVSNGMYSSISEVAGF